MRGLSKMPIDAEEIMDVIKIKSEALSARIDNLGERISNLDEGKIEVDFYLSCIFWYFLVKVMVTVAAMICK